MPINNIKKSLEQIPNSPGVYLMISEKGEVLYIGKAKNLKKRVSSYTKADGLAYRIQMMVSNVERVEFQVTKNESEALLLEQNLIKKHRPKYNILLKDDKSYPYIVITKHPFPRIMKYRKKGTGGTVKGKKFGPFVSVGAVNETISLLQKKFLLRPCSDNVFKSRKRPCMQYQINRCLAPCVGYISEDEYANQIGQAELFLKGKNKEIENELENEMNALIKTQGFEQAAVFHGKITSLKTVRKEQKMRKFVKNIKKE